MDRRMIVQTGLVLLACTLRSQASACEEDAAAPPRLFPFRQSGDDGKWGYMDRQGATVIEPQFDRADDFAEGLAWVALDEQETYIDQQGAVQVTVPPEWRWVGRFSEGLAACLIGDKYGFFDKQGEVLVQPRYDDVESFREGLAVVSMYTEPPPPSSTIRSTIRSTARFSHRPTVSGYVDKQGREVIPPVFFSAHDFHEGMAYVVLEGGIGYINKRGKVVVRLYHDLKNRPKQYTLYGRGDFSEGLACIDIANGEGGEQRYLTKAGEFLPRETFPPWCGTFREGLAAFSRSGKSGYILVSGYIVDGDKWGFVNRTGEIVCKPTFDEADDFSEGLANVRIGEHWGYIDRRMEFLIRPGESCSDGRGPLNDAEPFSDGLARVHIGGVFDGDSNVLHVWYFGTWFYMNKQGDLVRRIRHDDEPGPGHGMEYRPYGNAPEVTEEMKEAWEKWQSDHSAEERSDDIGDLAPSLPKASAPSVEQE